MLLIRYEGVLNIYLVAIASGSSGSGVLQIASLSGFRA